jgi:hypothetical protein
MDALDSVAAETLRSGRADWLGPALLKQLSAHPLDCLDTEYPHHAQSMDDPDDVDRPSERNPVFYGCYDWHSAVHSHWCLVRQRRLFPDHPEADAIVATIDDRLTPENVAQEVAYFQANETFERPYGWGWYLRLVGELALWADPRAAEWRATLEPLTDRIEQLVRTAFLTQDRPFRVGTHQNSAFGLACVLDYARVVDAADLEAETARTARSFFGDDEDYPVAYEPLGWDFLSPGLTEADLMRRVLAPEAFREWVDGFLPDLTEPPADAILEPLELERDPEDGLALHFVGLHLSKAAALAGLAETLSDHRYHDPLRDSATRHARAGLDLAFTDDYAGAHWLSSFVLYLLTRNEDGIAPAQ